MIEVKIKNFNTDMINKILSADYINDVIVKSEYISFTVNCYSDLGKISNLIKL